jgi:hypothetical protein
MNEKLDFSLPAKKQKKSFLPILSVVLLIVLIGLSLINILVFSGRAGFARPFQNGVRSTSYLSSQQVEELASRLAGRDLYAQAASVWQDYLSGAALSDTERAKTLFQIGTLLEKAGTYAQAIEYFYRSEMTAKIDELEPQINVHLRDCFQKLGMFSALRYELMDRTSFEKQEPAGGKIVAEIGPEKITEADLDAMIEETIDNQLAPIASFMTADQLNDRKQKMLEQYKSPEAKTQFLQSWLAQEVLYRQALEQNMPDEPEVKKVLEDMTRSVLSRQLMNKELADKINVTETDLQTYYQANKDKYIEPAKKDDPNSVDRQKSFDEVRDQVMNELVSRKSQDVQSDYIKQMINKYNVVIHTSVLGGTEEKAAESSEQKTK